MTDLGARPRRPGPTVRTRVTELGEDGERKREDQLATEEPLEIRVAWPGSPAQRVWVTMRTPGHDFELAAGFSCHEAIATPAAIRGIAYCTDVDLTPEQEFNVVTVTLNGPTDIGHRHAGLSAGSSACGVCGKDSVTEVLDSVRGVRTAWTGPLPHPDVVRGLPESLREGQAVFSRTGGVHAAGLFTAEGERVVACHAGPFPIGICAGGSGCAPTLARLRFVTDSGRRCRFRGSRTPANHCRGQGFR